MAVNLHQSPILPSCSSDKGLVTGHPTPAHQCSHSHPEGTHHKCYFYTSQKGLEGKRISIQRPGDSKTQLKLNNL